MSGASGTDPRDRSADEALLARPGMVEAVSALRSLTLAGERFRHAVAEHFGADVSATMAMSHLSSFGPLSPRELATKMGLTPSTVTALLDRLEAAGMTSRAAHPTDRRRVVISLTEPGQALLAWVQQRLLAALEVFDVERLPDLAAVLGELATALDAQTSDITKQTAEDADAAT